MAVLSFRATARRVLLAGLATAAVTTWAQPAPQAPQAPREARDVSVHGDTRIDDYFWLRHRQDPRVLTHLKAENAWSQAWFKPLEPLKTRLYDEMLARIQQDDEAVPYRMGRWWYSTRTVQGQAYPIYIRRAAAGADRHLDPQAPEQVMFDVNAMAQGKKYLALGYLTVSPDGQRAAYALDETGGRDWVLHVRDLGTGRDLDFKVPELSSVAWAADGRTLFFTTMDATKRSSRAWRAVPGSGQAPVLVHEEPDALFDIGIDTTRDGRYLVLTSTSKDENLNLVLDARQPAGRFRAVLPRRAGVMSELEHHNGRFYLRINDTGPDFRLISLDARRPDLARATEIIPAQPGLMISQVDAFRHHLVITERRQGRHTLVVRDLRRPLRDAQAEHLVQFDEPAYTVAGLQNREFDTDSFRFQYESLTTPAQVFDYGLDSRQRSLRKQQPVKGGYDPSRYVTERLNVTASDGTAVPVSLVYRKDLRLKGPQPMLLYAYGSYGFATDARFGSTRLSLLDRGVVFAIAHVRGGGDLGRSWYEAGKMARKANTFTDFVACAQALVDRGYTSPAHLAIQGGSAGGLLMGAAVNLRPDLFKAVVAEVPFVDVINTMLDETLPLTTSEFKEWGNPKLPEQYRWMRAYSPYDNLKAGAYPAMLLITSLNDSQVPYWEPAKYTARLRTLKTDNNPLLLTINLDAGHGGASGRFDALKERSQVYAFLLSQWGLTDTPPAP